MSLLLNCHSLAKSYGSKQLFKNVSFGIFQGDKIGLIGPNGSGKSSLLKILAGLDKPDEGTVSYRKSLRTGYVPQSSEYPDLSIEEVLRKVCDHTIPIYEQQTQIEILLSKMGFEDFSQNAQTLSGGWKKRLDIARELILNPDILLLDEPTNHLDLEGIIWLEKFLQQQSLALLVISHDRYFLQNSVTKMMELNSIYPQGLFCSEGSYLDYMEKRDEFIRHQQQSERVLASKVKGEVDWLRQSPKARTTKSQARIQEAGRLMQELSSVRNRNQQTTAKIDFESSERQSKKLIAAKNLGKSLGNRSLFSGLDIVLVPGMRLGIVGGNGTGKTTLLKLFANEIGPDKGTIKYAEDLKIVYFDQHREALNPDDTLRQALSPNHDTVTYRGQNIHVNSWAKRFLFSPDKLDLPIKYLSGGERARIGIACLMLKPADLLLLDEPTNDLDISTLETLEESLLEFPGAIVFITHDRALLNRLATCIIGLGYPKKPPPILADYQQWELYIKDQSERSYSENSSPAPLKKDKDIGSKQTSAESKLSYREKKELEQMETHILTWEQKISDLERLMHEYSDNKKLLELQEACKQLEATQYKLESLYKRWQELENRS